VKGQRQDSLFEKALTQSFIAEVKRKKVEEELEEWTFKPHINKKSPVLNDSTKKVKQESEKINKQKEIYPMKPKPISKQQNQANMFFDVHNHKAIERIETGHSRFSFRRNTKHLNEDMPEFKTFSKATTPDFDEIDESDDELEIDKIVRQVILNNGDRQSAFSRSPQYNTNEMYASPTFLNGEY
jgi:hypothetical protein